MGCRNMTGGKTSGAHGGRLLRLYHAQSRIYTHTVFRRSMFDVSCAHRALPRIPHMTNSKPASQYTSQRAGGHCAISLDGGGIMGLVRHALAPYQTRC